MKIEYSYISGVYKVQNDLFEDERGSFSRLFCGAELFEIMQNRSIVQINKSLTKSVGAIRGMHYQKYPHSETKIIRCLRGAVYDVVIDLRKNSTTFMNWDFIQLRPEWNNSIIIPEGCAHGFQSLEADSELLYFHTQYYNPQSEGGVRYDDPMISVKWPLEIGMVSNKDLNYRLLTNDFQGLEI